MIWRSTTCSAGVARAVLPRWCGATSPKGSTRSSTRPTSAGSSQAHMVPVGRWRAVGANRCPPVWLVRTRCSPGRAARSEPARSVHSDVPAEPQHRSRLPWVQTRRSSTSGVSTAPHPVGSSTSGPGRVDHLGRRDLQGEPPVAVEGTVGEHVGDDPTRPPPWLRRPWPAPATGRPAVDASRTAWWTGARCSMSPMSAGHGRGASTSRNDVRVTALPTGSTPWARSSGEHPRWWSVGTGAA